MGHALHSALLCLGSACVSLHSFQHLASAHLALPSPYAAFPNPSNILNACIAAFPFLSLIADSGGTHSRALFLAARQG